MFIFIITILIYILLFILIILNNHNKEHFINSQYSINKKISTINKNQYYNINNKNNKNNITNITNIFINNDIISFDFDGVLHKCVLKPTQSGQVHSKFTTKKDLIKNNCINTAMVNFIKTLLLMKKKIYIVSHNTILNKVGIYKFLQYYNINIPISNILISLGNKYNELEKIQAQVHIDDSLNVLFDINNEIHNNTKKLKLLYYTVNNGFIIYN